MPLGSMRSSARQRLAYAQIPRRLSSHAFLARFHYRHAAERSSTRDTGESERRPLPRFRYAIRLRGTGLLLRRTGEGNIASLPREVIIRVSASSFRGFESRHLLKGLMKPDASLVECAAHVACSAVGDALFEMRTFAETT